MNAIMAEFVDSLTADSYPYLRAGDMVSRVDGKDVVNMDFDKIVTRIRLCPVPRKVTFVNKTVPYVQKCSTEFWLRKELMDQNQLTLDRLHYFGYTAKRWNELLLQAARAGAAQEIKDEVHRTMRDVNGTTQTGSTALHAAVAAGQNEAVRTLLLLRGDPNIKDRNGMTALHIACQRGRPDYVQALLDEGAFINARDKMGMTGLLHAAHGGCRGAVAVMLEVESDEYDIPLDRLAVDHHWVRE